MNAIEIKDVHISYRTVQSTTLKHALLNLSKATVRRTKAVKGVTFNVEQGEIIGLVGRNGSGKSTLLRSIAGVFSPDSGTIDTKGQSVSLLAVGIGFQNELSGRDNVYLSGLLMGFTEEQIREKYDEIVEFSELEEFIDAPVKTYSSGMHSKLAFSITAFLEPDILLVDETLSVGDRRFRRKSFEKMKELIFQDHRTVVIVSHSSNTVRELCSRVIWMDDGIVVMDGPVKEVMDAYDEYMDSKRKKPKKAKKDV